jgi:hypothetical protein
MWKLTFLLIAAIATINASELETGGHRDPKLFFVSSSTSTSISTTTSLLSTTLSCYMLSSTTYMACPGRKKRATNSWIDDNALTDIALETPIKISRAERDVDATNIQSAKTPTTENQRAAKFAWYYMTTTVTSLSTSTSTSTTFTATVSISLVNCTPSGAFVACG